VGCTRPVYECTGGARCDYSRGPAGRDARRPFGNESEKPRRRDEVPGTGPLDASRSSSCERSPALDAPPGHAAEYRRISISHTRRTQRIYHFALVVHSLERRFSRTRVIEINRSLRWRPGGSCPLSLFIVQLPCSPYRPGRGGNTLTVQADRLQRKLEQKPSMTTALQS
jgi:hypothetical protein